MIKNCFHNFFKRFKYFFICFAMIFGGIIIAAGVFYGGIRLTINSLDEYIVINLYDYFNNLIHTIKPTDIISLSILGKIYKDFINIANDEQFLVKLGITLTSIVCIFIVYGCYKGSIAIVNYISKRQLRDDETKHGFVPFIIKLLIGFGFAALLMVLLHLWKWSFIFILIFYILIDSLEEVISIRYVYFNNIPLKRFLLSKSFINVIFTYLLYQYLILIIASLLWLVTPFISLFIMVPILAYNECNIEYTIITMYKEKNNKIMYF